MGTVFKGLNPLVLGQKKNAVALYARHHVAAQTCQIHQVGNSQKEDEKQSSLPSCSWGTVKQTLTRNMQKRAA